MRIRLTEAELKTALAAMTIQVDSREKENRHIISHFDNRKLIYKSRKLDFADYTATLPAMPEIGIMRELHFDRDIAIERKASLEELSGNLTQERQRFENELIRAAGCKLFLLIEGGSFEAIAAHKYRTRFEPKAFIAALRTYEARYGLRICFAEKDYAGEVIASILAYHLREKLLYGLAA